MKFSARRNKDSFDAFEKALVQAGHEYVKKPEEADFIFFDSENVGRRRKLMEVLLRDRPGFIYPHTPQTCWLWDGVYESLPVMCNFVAAKGQKAAMREYGYPYPVETVGFPRCEVLPFTPTSGKRVLFVPSRPRKDGGKQAKLDLEVFNWLIGLSDYFDEVVVCRVIGQFQEQFDSLAINYGKFHDIVTNPKASPSPALDMVERIDKADLVIAQNTPAYLAVARGKPTIFYGETLVPETTMGRAPLHYEDYAHLLRYPLTLEEMSIKDVMLACESESPEVRRWKGMNIGRNFDPELFVRLVEACLTK